MKGPWPRKPNLLPPNLSHNVGIVRPHDRWFVLVAILGIILQGGVLAFAACATYYFRWEKNEKQSPTYACPMAITGTLLVCGGVFLCAAIVGESTDEVHYHRRKCSEQNSYLCWIQPRQTLGDQTYDSFCYIDRHKLGQYTVSWRRKKEDNPSELVVWAVVGITVSGFVLQFVDLRGIHSAVSMAQLGVALFMTMARAALRAQRRDVEDNEIHRDPWQHNIVAHHELDWLAFRLADDHIKREFEFNPMVRLGGPSWRFCGMAEQGERLITYQPDPKSRGPPMQSTLDAVDRLVAYRSRLASLTTPPSGQSGIYQACRNFEPDKVLVRATASKLALAIESAATKVFTTSPSLKKGWSQVKHMSIATECGIAYSFGERWYQMHSCNVERRRHMLVHLTRKSFELGSDGNHWSLVNQHDVEAILGLWVWSLQSDPGTIRSPLEIEGRRIVCWNNDPEGMGWNSWAGGRLKMPRENRITSPDHYWNPHTIWFLESNGHDLEKFTSSPQSNVSRSRLLGWYFGDMPSVSKHSYNCSIWTLPATSNLLPLCAQEMFGVLVKSLLEATKDIGQVDIQEDSDGRYLKSRLMSDLVDIMTENELASRDDAISCLLPLVVFEELSANRTPLWYSARNGHEGMTAELLATSQFDKDLKDAEGQGPLWQAATNGHHTVVGLLLDHGADPNASDNAGMTPLAKAAANGHETVIQLLLEGGVADLDFKDRAGRTALSYAAACGFELVVELLLEEGADAKAVDDSGSTPLSRAVNNGHEGVVRLIRTKDYPDDTRLQGDGQINDERKNRIANAYVEYHYSFLRKHIFPLGRHGTKTVQPWRRGIRVALLSTGIDLKHPKLEEGIRKSIQWKDMVNNGDATDLDGYGTTIAQLTHEYGPKAEIYVARVVRDQLQNQQTAQATCKAINWAMMACDADIIVISVTFPSTDSAVKAVIDIAYRKGKVIIAAAAPIGFNSRRRFPANNPRVIGIHAVDGRGKDCGLSPMPVRGDYNFSALGVAVRPLGPEEYSHENRYVSGAGFAAAVAAGATASILEFARFNLKLDDPEDQKWLCSTEGVREMLRLVSTNIDGYNCIAPWTLFGDTSDPKDICDIIMMVVRKRRRGVGQRPRVS
ncbi:hypothetical protein FDECE_12714 [Fusarium decemcellulare]|nr:hypothetical protein FDECE_12714 [Fusarium decemcellulare]